MKKRIALWIAVLMLTTALVGCTNAAPAAVSEAAPAAAPATEAKAETPAEPAAEKLQVALVSNEALDTQTWLQNMKSGIEAYQAESGEFEFSYLEALETNEYEPTIRGLAEAGMDVIITTYSAMADATIAVAKDFPDTKFACFFGGITNIAEYPNILCFQTSRVEHSFMSGVAAAMMSKTKTVGIVGGADEPDINAIIAGYQQGVWSVDPAMKVIVVYSNSFTDVTVCKELGLTLISQGCDVISGAAGGASVGTAQACQESGNCYYVSWDDDFVGDVFSKDANLQLGTCIGYFDLCVKNFVEDVLNGDFKGGTSVTYGLESGAVQFLIQEYSPLSEDARAKIEEDLQKISSGEIVISTEISRSETAG